MLSSLNKVLCMTLEHALLYDFDDLRSEIRKSFPARHHNLDIPNRPDLLNLGLLRNFMKGETETLNNLNDVVEVLKAFRKIDSEEHKDFVKVSRNKSLLYKFLMQLEELSALMDFKERVITMKFQFNQQYFNDENEETSSPEKKKRKHGMLKDLQQIQQASVNLEVVEENIEKVIQNISKNGFNKVFVDYLMKTVLNRETELELCYKNIEHQSDSLDLEDQEVKLLYKHLEKLPKNKGLGDKNIEKKLIAFVKELTKNEEAKEPKWCPIIYLANPVTGGIDGIKIKNAWED